MTKKTPRVAKPKGKKLASYQGYGYTADGFDCAIQARFETYNCCSYGCLYCFSTQLSRDAHRKKNFRLGGTNLKAVEQVLSGNIPAPKKERKLPPGVEKIWTTLGSSGSSRKIMHDYLTQKSKGRRRVAQWGGVGEPFDRFEMKHGVSLQMAELFKKYKQPIRISTKGGAEIFGRPEYQRALDSKYFWVAFSLITIDDDLLLQIDKHTPTATSRLKAMKILSDMGIPCSMRFRPIIPGLSDHTKKHPKAWSELLEKAAEAGCKAISMEVLFAPGALTAWMKKNWDELERVLEVPLRNFYKQHGAHGSCVRVSRSWTEEIVMKIRAKCHELGMVFAISDPLWKEYNDYECCCGISPKDPIFGNFEKKQATAALVRASRGKGSGEDGDRVVFEDVVPWWADKTLMHDLVCMSGARNLYKARHMTWEDKLRVTFNDLKSNRGPLQYFQGVLMPVGRDENGNVIYEYSKAKRTKKGKYSSPLWDIR